MRYLLMITADDRDGYQLPPDEAEEAMAGYAAFVASSDRQALGRWMLFAALSGLAAGGLTVSLVCEPFELGVVRGVEVHIVNPGNVSPAAAATFARLIRGS